MHLQYQPHHRPRRRHAARELSRSHPGVHWAGAYKVSDAAKLNWLVSCASQGDYADNPNDHSADYYPLEGGAKKSFEVMFKFADCQADEFATDTAKFWLQFAATF